MMYDIPASANDVPKLEDYIAAAKERWRLIVIVVLAIVLLAVLFTRTRTPIFEAEARVLVNPSIADSTGSNPAYPVLEREREVLSGVATANLAATAIADGTTGLGILRDIQVTFVNDSDTLALVYPDPDPERAADVVNSMGDAYVELRETGSLRVYDSQLEPLTAEIDVLRATVAELNTQFAVATTARSSAQALPGTVLTKQAQIDEANQQLTLVVNDRTEATRSLATLERDFSTLNRQKASRGVTAEVLEYANPPGSPAGIGDSLILVAATMFGLIAGVGLAFVLDRLDRTARDSSDVEGALRTTVLGNVPNYGPGGRRQGLIMLNGAKNTRAQRVREAYRRARASLQFLQSSKDLQALMVTSARPGEGKSSTVANIAVAAAQSGSQVVIVSADMRRPTLERMFGINSARGLSDYLIDPNNSDIMVPVEGVEGLVVIPSGPIPDNPGDLLGSPAFSQLIETLKDQFDLILIDTPPILSAADAGSAAPACDGTLIVVDSQRTDTDSLLRVQTAMERTGGNVVGAILNKDSSDTGISLRRDRYAYEKVAGQR